MPQPAAGENEEAFVSRCIPIVLDEGTADDNSQAAAICHSLWDNRNKMETETKNKKNCLYKIKANSQLSISVQDVDLTKRIVTGFYSTYNVLDSDGDIFLS